MHCTVGAAIVLFGAVFYAAGQAPPAQPASSTFVGILDEHPAIQYVRKPTRDRVALLNEAIAKGAAPLAHAGPSGYLQALLKALDVPTESQLLVFSKTGIQRRATGPQNPRAIYFDDSVVVGYIPGAPVLEIAVHDPQQGVVFYTIDQATSSQAAPQRRTNCLGCHVSGSTLDGRGYPSHDSDIAALMVFDHQMHAINLLTRINWESRVAAANGRITFDSGILRELVDELTDYFVFVDEVAPPSRLTPRPGFAERFTAVGRKDRQGRSLRQLDLDRRLLLYPCSYMVYSEAFDALPTATRDAIYQRMWAILSGADASRKYAHLSAADRRAIIEILRDTKVGLPAVWNAPPGV